jgi:hypothetical protein
MHQSAFILSSIAFRYAVDPQTAHGELDEVTLVVGPCGSHVVVEHVDGQLRGGLM